ncbi:MAG: hypothetical protein GFH27_549283n420 [Chloroflexi bacterium AL-W]|nr:hypothetical protein [Chloroflexi bacterium AL-N1]NOK64459.1 hypothetical protein [Chloroflexi bacterium AL-N10]NOK75701.1 hypothetical protein [Chloroflexi bacterium AL-N5]NOK80541.1 hypothetical protein [Chloroflexi bacterium AL-W]NOK87055.1 hypothetical protein [Chloroflexi bacterium AL-N15]
MPRGRSVPAKKAAAEQEKKEFTFSRPVKLIREEMTITDVQMFARIAALAQANDRDEDANMRLMEAIDKTVDILDRIVEGGMKGRPASEFWAVVQEVQTQMGEAANEGN